MQEFTLRDVVSNRILETGWRDRIPEEVITLTEGQKRSFVEIFGRRAHKQTRQRLESFIKNPRLYRFQKTWWMDRVYFGGEQGDGCFYCAGQDHRAEVAEIRSIIANA